MNERKRVIIPSLVVGFGTVGARTSTGALHAIGDGIARVAAAPAILVGTIAVVLLYAPGDADLRHGVGALLISTFLFGGILDRYARRRPTRARGFFAACGAHFGAILRTWLIVCLVLLLFHAVVGQAFENDYVHEAGFLLGVLIAAIVLFAQVRIAVEDRRSAIGAWLAGGRFLFRNPAAAGIVVLFVAAEILSTLAYERALVRSGVTGAAAWLLTDAWVAAETFFVLATLASGVSLFQARLAHAGYTAVPQATWPDSPAAEAIASAPPTLTS
jgi:hypothetical protein